MRPLPLAALATALLAVAACDPGQPDPPASSPAASPGTAPPVVAAEGVLEGAGGLPLRYRVLGGPPDTVVVVHGGPGAGMESVLPSVEPLARTHTLILFDQRGGGRSGLPEDTTLLSAPYFVADLEAVRRHFGLEAMRLVSHSFGSVLVAEYARAHPDRVSRIVLHGATGPDRREAARLALRAREETAPADTALARRARAVLTDLLSGTAAEPRAACREYEELSRRMARARGETPSWRGSTCRAPDSAVAYYYRYTARLAPRSFGDWDYGDGALAAVDAPVLVLVGSEDSPASRSQQRAWAEAYPRGRLLTVEGAGKGAFDEAPEAVFPALATFLRGEWPAGARAP